MAPETFLGDSGQEPSKASCVSPLQDPLLSSQGQVGVQGHSRQAVCFCIVHRHLQSLSLGIPPSPDQESRVMGSGP